MICFSFCQYTEKNPNNPMIISKLISKLITFLYFIFIEREISAFIVAHKRYGSKRNEACRTSTTANVGRSFSSRSIDWSILSILAGGSGIGHFAPKILVTFRKFEYNTNKTRKRPKYAWPSYAKWVKFFWNIQQTKVNLRRT